MFRLLRIVALLWLPALPVHAVEATVNGTDLTLRTDDGTVLTGPALAGVVLTVADNDGSQILIRINGAEPDPWDARRWLYDLSAETSPGHWQPFCKPGPYGLTLGFPVAGTTTPDGSFNLSNTQISFSCTAGAVAKCIRFGYAPWDTAADGTPLLDHFRACMRMVRADYCGDSTPHTRDGTLINVYDRLGIQTSEPAETLSFEAAWGPDGAICVRHTRIPAVFTLSALHKACGQTLAPQSPAACSPDTAAKALLFNDSAGR